MKFQIQKWGEGFTFRIHKEIADELQWKVRTLVHATVQSGKFVIESQTVPDYELEDLLKGMTPEVFQEDVDTGLIIGNEVW